MVDNNYMSLFDFWELLCLNTMQYNALSQIKNYFINKKHKIQIWSLFSPTEIDKITKIYLNTYAINNND